MSSSLSLQSLMWKENSSRVLPEGSTYAETRSDALPISQYGDEMRNCHVLNKEIPPRPSNSEGLFEDNAGLRHMTVWHLVLN